MQQSSTTAMLRALVMLSVLVAIPAVAVIGTDTPLPELIKKLRRGEWPIASSSPSGPIDDAPRFIPEGSGGPIPSVRPRMMAAGAASGLNPLGMSGPGHPSNGSIPATMPVGLESGTPSAVVPASYVEPGTMSPSEPGSATDFATLAPAGTPPRPIPVEANDPFTRIETRLRELGATYYVLETWGNRQDRYRFLCRIALGGNPNYTRQFEHYNATQPLEAMANVLEQVEDWRRSQQLAGQ